MVTKSNCDVAMLVDAETGERGLRGRFSLGSGMERRVHAALRARYRCVAVVPFGPDIPRALEELRALRPRMVLNLTEWFDGNRGHDFAIAALLDLMNIRYTGSGPAGLQLGRDKARSKHVVAAAGVDVPRHFTLARGARIRNPGVPYPLIVKPQFGDGSEELGKVSLVRSPRELRARVRAIHSRLKEPLICEEFIPGRDIYVGLLGNEPRVLAPTQMTVGRRKGSAPRFATYRLKNDSVYRAKWRVRYQLADLPPRIMRQLKEYSRTAFHALKLRDYARLDYRLTDEGRLVFIEANPNCDLTPHTMGPNLCFPGIEYGSLIPRIVEIARKRNRRRHRTD